MLRISIIYSILSLGKSSGFDSTLMVWGARFGPFSKAYETRKPQDPNTLAPQTLSPKSLKP